MKLMNQTKIKAARCGFYFSSFYFRSLYFILFYFIQFTSSSRNHRMSVETVTKI